MIQQGKVIDPARRAAESLAVALALAIYLVACLVPAMTNKDGSRPSAGWQLLLYGYVPRGTIPWSSNVFFFFGCVFLLGGHRMPAMVLGVLASILGVSTFLILNIINGSVTIGFYLWESSFVVLTAGCILLGPSPASGKAKPAPGKADLREWE